MSKNYFLASVRQASFRAPRRTSTACNARIPKWPHKNGKRYADAGFYFDPTPGHEDNVTCFLCSKSLDGWEPGDDPVSEHYRHSPDCGWAITAEILDSHDQNFTCDPHSDQSALGRLQTFGDGVWPHPDTGNLSVVNMANAGFHYAPTKGEIDNCICPFCHISLASFEPEDNPREEHYRRKPHCYFFETEPLKKSAKRAPHTSTVPKKPAARRASRANSAAPPESPVERALSLRDSVDSREEEEEEPRPARGKRAGSAKPKATAARKGGRKKAVPEYATSTYSMSDVDDAPKRGRKRSSSIMSKEPVIMFDGGIDTESGSDEEIVVQPKKRTTRASMARQPVVDIIADPPKRQRTTRASIAKQSALELSFTDEEDTAEIKPKKNRRVLSKQIKIPARNKAYAPLSDNFNDPLDHDQPFTDEEENTTHQKPFIRSTKKETRSRISLAVEQSMRDAPPDILIPAAIRGKNKAGSRSGNAAPAKTPMKSFFRDSELDYSMPISIPRHLNRDAEILDQNNDTPVESEPEPSPPPSPKKGRAKVKKVAGTEDEDLKPAKRTKVSKKKGAVRGRSNTADSQAQPIEPVPAAVKVEAHGHEGKTSAIASPRPDPRRVGGPRRAGAEQESQQLQRESLASLVSTIPDAASTVPDEHPYLPHRTEQIPEVPIRDVAEKEEELSESGSVVRHIVEVQHVTEPEPERSPSPPPPPQSVRKSPRKASPQKASPKKTSPRKVNPKKNQRQPTPSESERESDTKEHEEPTPSLAPSSPFQEHISPRHEVHEMEIDGPRYEPELPVGSEGVEQEEPEVIVAESSHREPTDSPDPAEQPRAPLSPVRRQMMVPLQSTPKAKQARTVQTSRPWSPIDLDVVFASQPGVEVDEAGLTAAERDMTVEEWVKWNAANAERRLNERGERMIVIFEEKGRSARACIEGIPTV